VPFARTNKVARTSSAGNPITQSVTVTAQDSVIVLLLKVTGATSRAGGAPTLGSLTMTQANSTQKAATTPEASAEIWYVLLPRRPTVTLAPGSYTLTVPNTGAATCKYTVEAGQASGGGGVPALDGSNGGNATSTNPTPGAVTVQRPGSVAWAITAGGWTTWAPSAQAGTVIANTDDGADGGGEQYKLDPALGALTLSWTFGTSDDWGAVVALFGETAPPNLNNYLGVSADDGIGVGEKVR
jgi:hypothetical protein